MQKIKVGRCLQGVATPAKREDDVTSIRMTVMAAGLTLAAAGPGFSGPLLDAAVKAEQMASSGDAAGARDTMRTAMIAFSASLPFSVGKAAFVTGEPKGYGMYEPRPTSAFRPGEKISSYIEPVGLTWTPVSGKPDLTEARFTADFELFDAGGAVIGGTKAFGSFQFTAMQPRQEVFAVVGLDMSNVPLGTYVLRYHFNDANGRKAASVDMPFSISASP
jgi:hypothetical protein